MEAELAVGVELLQTIAELSPEDFRERFDREQITARDAFPSPVLISQSTASDNAMEVVMIEQRLAPGMQDGGEADLRFKLSFPELE